MAFVSSPLTAMPGDELYREAIRAKAAEYMVDSNWPDRIDAIFHLQKAMGFTEDYFKSNPPIKSAYPSPDQARNHLIWWFDTLALTYSLYLEKVAIERKDYPAIKGNPNSYFSILGEDLFGKLINQFELKLKVIMLFNISDAGSELSNMAKRLNRIESPENTLSILSRVLFFESPRLAKGDDSWLPATAHVVNQAIEEHLFLRMPEANKTLPKFSWGRASHSFEDQWRLWALDHKEKVLIYGVPVLANIQEESLRIKMRKPPVMLESAAAYAEEGGNGITLYIALFILLFGIPVIIKITRLKTTK